MQILHVNAIGHDSGLVTLEASTDLPILQDDTTADVWNQWGATWRDVYVLDNDNEVYAVYNLTSNSLADPANYAALYDLFVEASVAP
ncbi:MAG: hypothetical protein Q8P41_27105 [Pseudomonadota bacterium]|nr:hypothetical protein [Pseudomonadota bacterium]